MTAVIVIGENDLFEYWCASCRQLRLSSDDKRITCGNCGALIRLKGEPGALDADELRARTA